MTPEAFELAQLLARLPTDRHAFTHVFCAPSGRLSLTVARWPAGSVDDQTPHVEDEVYLVWRGCGRLTVAGKEHAVAPGSVVYVAANAEHRFHDIVEDLEVLVFWSPPRGAV